MRRIGDSLLNAMTRTGAPLAVALTLSTLLFALTGYDIVDVWSGIWQGAVAAPGSLEQTIRWATPLLLIGLGILITLRTGEFNIGAQGQLMLGGLGAVSVALLWTGVPPLLVLLVALLAGIVGGALWSLIAGLLKVRLGADEVITTLMLNFIAALLIQWVTTGPLRNDALRGETASTELVEPALRLSTGTGVSLWLIVIVLLATIAAWFIVERTEFGLKSKLIGFNPVTAAWQGVDVKRLRLATYLFAGGFAGLAGALEVLGPNGRLVTGASQSLGFTAIVVAIVGLLRVPGVVLAALFFGGIQAALLYLPIVSDLPSSGLRILEGMVALLITAHLFRRRRQLAKKREKPQEPQAAPADGATA